MKYCEKCHQAFVPNAPRHNLCVACATYLSQKRRNRLNATQSFAMGGEQPLWRKLKNENDRTARPEPSLPRIKWLERPDV